MFLKLFTKYRPVQDEDKAPLMEKDSISLECIPDCKNRRLGWIIVMQWVFIFLLVGAVAGVVLWKDRVPDLVYSPAQDIVRYKNLVFNSGWGDQQSRYMGPPSEENNRAWDDLHNAPGIIKIPIHDAAKLVNKTVPIPDDPGYYAIGLDVFHQLHCLDTLRKALWGQPRDTDTCMDMDHLDHCVESIRQSLMCSADISVVAWTWDEKKQRVHTQADMIHTCRDFGLIWQWAMDHRAGGFNRTVHVLDPLVNSGS